MNVHEVTAAIGQIVGDKFVGTGSSLAAIGIKMSVPSDDTPPAWLVHPGSAAEIAEVVVLAGRAGGSVIPVGNAARSPRSGAVGDRPRFFVDIRRMSHVLHLDETSLVVHAQAGLSAIALEKILSPRGLSLGDYPPAALGSTLGGLLAVRTPGKSSTRHGFIEDAVLGLSAVLADGRSIHTRIAPRRSTGPDLARALCGSEGTLGIITSAVLRVHRRPETRYLSAYALPTIDASLAAVHLALREEAAPAALRVFDRAEAIVHLGALELEESESVLVVATAGPTDLAACDRDLVTSAVEAMNGRPLDQHLARIWWDRRTGQEGVAPVPVPHLQISATPSKQLPVYRAVRDAAIAAGANARGHVSRFDADGAVLFFTLHDAGTPLDDARAATLREATEAAAHDAGAFLLGTANPQMEPYFVTLRHTLDPHGVMNPGALR
ncbi:MAG TPA: FAD-binding oxidoreductase [Kofleriaceae bacterium]|nr:FAD-binding oxidoreductase [Kofleriaceae bacterium]